MVLGATNSETFKTSKHTADQNTIYKISGPLVIKLMLFVDIIAVYLQQSHVPSTTITYTKHNNHMYQAHKWAADKKAEF
jgi:hypothetical protein